MQVGKGEGGIPHLKTYLYILTFQFFKMCYCVWSAYLSVCVHVCLSTFV